MNTTILPKQYEDAQDFLELWGTDYVEFYVGNAKQSAYYFKTAFGFQEVAYAGLETGVTDRTSYVLQQDKIRLVITSSMVENSDINRHLNEHGDGVKIVALWVPDATKAFEETTKRGAKPFQQPQVSEDSNGKVVTSGIYTYGETVHLFVERNDYNGPFLPGYVARSPKYQPESVGLKYIDHMVGNVDWGQMNTWVKFYADVMGFSQIISFDDNDISTEYTALMSKVMSNGNGRIKFPINEPAEGKKRSQIEEYINFYNGAGVQHLALATDNIIYTIHELRERGVDFLDVPDSYYLDLQDRVGAIDEDIEVLKKYKILVDRDDEGYLLQLFTKPLMDRPTVFIEIIQRKGATSFGKGNFKALFEAIEREQENRGTL
ncbi:MAG: 4-hydroxyphenylpyruvate dioxygenase [Schleiferiaceae bacterium]|jgi:4-hydroxyphenylpyruvate dioxygenase|nr:4-hydroxyphenylpyruvate dioxygenase [Schleiferiaceae bacterium]MDP4959224.1 4-hydroxyphenylpyruvate dioxygenase [Schleiferiaceae bacterium]